MQTVEIVRLSAEHIAEMHRIEEVSFPVAWPADSFERELSENKLSHYLVALIDGCVAGYIGGWIVMDELHIATFAVDPVRRRSGVGRLLLARMLADAIERDVRWSVLEVRESNVAAIRLYEAFGFRQVGVRKRYYENDENARVLWVGQMQQKDFRDQVARHVPLSAPAADEDADGDTACADGDTACADGSPPNAPRGRQVRTPHDADEASDHVVPELASRPGAKLLRTPTTPPRT